MPFPLIPVAIGAGLLALLAFTAPKKATTPAAPGTAPGATPAVPPTPGAQPMPAQLKAQYDDLLANGLNAPGLETVAAELEKYGFTNEAATLRARAAQLRAAAAAQAAPPTQPPPFVPGVFDQPVPQVTPTIPPFVFDQFPLQIPGINIPLTPPDAPTPLAVPGLQQAKVTTGEPPPGGDLIMRDSPSDSGNQVPGGGAEKDGIVTVVDPNASPDGVWAMIIWPGGSRRPAAQGFAKKKYLVNLPPSPTTSGVVIGASTLRYAKCAAPSGCRLRVAPSTMATFRAIVGCGEVVQVIKHAQGEKADYGSPGLGGWAMVKYKTLTGWLPSEWLVAA